MICQQIFESSFRQFSFYVLSDVNIQIFDFEMIKNVFERNIVVCVNDQYIQYTFLPSGIIMLIGILQL